MSQAPVPAKTWPDVLAPFSDLIKTLLGPAAEQYGLVWGESAYLFRRKRLARLLEKASNRLAEARIEPHAVKFSLLNDIVERGGLEDNDSLQDMWANLLANASGGQTLVTTAFVDILKSLSFDEAVFVTMLSNGAMGDRATWNLDPVQFGNLKRLGLIMTEEDLMVPRTAAGIDAHAMRIAMGGMPEELCYLTDLGMAFVNACMAPKPKEPS
jgi:hypothetical protein